MHEIMSSQKVLDLICVNFTFFLETTTTATTTTSTSTLATTSTTTSEEETEATIEPEGNDNVTIDSTESTSPTDDTPELETTNPEPRYQANARWPISELPLPIPTTASDVDYPNSPVEAIEEALSFSTVMPMESSTSASFEFDESATINAGLDSVDTAMTSSDSDNSDSSPNKQLKVGSTTDSVDSETIGASVSYTSSLLSIPDYNSVQSNDAMEVTNDKTQANSILSDEKSDESNTPSPLAAASAPSTQIATFESEIGDESDETTMPSTFQTTTDERSSSAEAYTTQALHLDSLVSQSTTKLSTFATISSVASESTAQNTGSTAIRQTTAQSSRMDELSRSISTSSDRAPVMRPNEIEPNPLFDSLFKPQKVQQFKRSLDDSVLMSQAFKDNFGTLANSAEYRRKAMRFMNDYKMNSYQVLYIVC